MKYLFALLLSIPGFIFSQTKELNTQIISKNEFEISVIEIFPDSFPLVSVIFQARDQEGNPLWLLPKDEFQIEENESSCDIIRLKNISKETPLNMALVFDHSGSMVDNPKQMPDSLTSMQSHYFSGLELPDNYIMPIEYAKKGVKVFLNEEQNKKDSTLFVGFSNTVDSIAPLSNKVDNIINIVDSVKPYGRTAFFDAVYAATLELSKSNTKAVVIALTDGQDNESNHSIQEVIDLANQNNISIYTIGLGNVNPSILSTISHATKGFHYFTEDPETLVEIYRKIKKQLKSIYQIDYTSSENFPNSDYRSLKFQSLNDTLTFNPNVNHYELPEEVVNYIAREKEKRQIRNITLGSASVITLGFATFLIISKRRKKKKKILLKEAFPNPFKNELKIKYLIEGEYSEIELQFVSITNDGTYKFPLVKTEKYFEADTSNIKKGNYVLLIVADNEKSNPIKIIKTI